MKKIIYFCCATSTLLILAACQTPRDGKGTAMGSDTFRDKWMALGCTGIDVQDWQTFLSANTNNSGQVYLPAGTYTPGTFGQSTVNGTVAFQADCVHNDPSGKVGPNSWNYANSYATNKGRGHNLVSSDGSSPTTPSQTSCQ